MAVGGSEPSEGRRPPDGSPSLRAASLAESHQRAWRVYPSQAPWTGRSSTVRRAAGDSGLAIYPRDGCRRVARSAARLKPSAGLETGDPAMSGAAMSGVLVLVCVSVCVAPALSSVLRETTELGKGSAGPTSGRRLDAPTLERCSASSQWVSSSSRSRRRGRQLGLGGPRARCREPRLPGRARAARPRCARAGSLHAYVSTGSQITTRSPGVRPATTGASRSACTRGDTASAPAHEVGGLLPVARHTSRRPCAAAALRASRSIATAASDDLRPPRPTKRPSSDEVRLVDHALRPAGRRRR